MDLLNIIRAWGASYFATDEQKQRAEERLEICNSCEFIKEISIGHICGKCRCPIRKKVFSLKFNDCPEKKWRDVDVKFFGDHKIDKTLL